MAEDWHGEERRGIPIHILNYVDERLSTHVEKVEALMAGHVGEEMERYQEIITLIEEKDRKSEERHHSLVQSITAYMGHVEMVQGAFIEDEKGHPDFVGHRNDHDKRKRFGQWWGDVKERTITKVLEWGVLAFIGWVAYSLWESFLKGPHK
jgi:hypothetical protein